MEGAHLLEGVQVSEWWPGWEYGFSNSTGEVVIKGSPLWCQLRVFLSLIIVF